MSRLKLKEVSGSKAGEDILAWAIPVILTNRMMGRVGNKITEHFLSNVSLHHRSDNRQFTYLYCQMVNANRKRVLAMSYSLAAQVRAARPDDLIADLEVGMAAAALGVRSVALSAIVVAGKFIEKERHNVSELNAWKQFFSVEIAKQGEWDNHNLAEYGISKYL